MSKQLPLWHGLRADKITKMKGKSRKGQNARRKKQREILSLNEKLVVKLRRELRPSTEIAQRLGIDYRTVDHYIKECFGDKDPLHLYVLEQFNGGKSAKKIAQELRIDKTIPGRILRLHGFSPRDEYLKRNSKSYAETGVTRIAKQRKSKERQAALIDDFKCFLRECGTLENVAEETGYSGAHISQTLNKDTQYREDSKARIAASRYKQRQFKTNQRSTRFNTEKEFQDYCVSFLSSEFKVEQNVFRGHHMEIDLLVAGKATNKQMFVELKISTRKTTEAKAVGQVMLNLANSGDGAVGVICYPADVKLSKGFVALANNIGITVCYEMQLLALCRKLLI